MYSARIFFRGGLVAYRALFFWKAPLSFLTTLIINPVMQVAFFLLATDDSLAGGRVGVLLGTALMASSLPGIFGGAMAVGNERAFGTLANVLLTPASKSLVFLGRGLPYVVNGVFSSAVVFLLTMPFVGELHLADFFRVLAAVVPGALSCTALGLVVGSLGLLLRDIWLVANLTMLCLLVLTGAVIPVDTLPGALRLLSVGTPLTHAIAFARGGDVTSLLLETTVAVVYFTIATLLLHHVERAARTRGSLELA
ncbi:ABC transporter permease [Streptomyces griseofuscus]|uniref:ABC transporter permease n=1 Tax=Streptomyces griseofuscus TaxID=146922 RepID=UPI003677B602